MAYDFEKAKQRADDAAYIAANLVEAYMQGFRNHQPSGRPYRGDRTAPNVGFAEVLRHEVELYYADPPKKPTSQTAKPVIINQPPAPPPLTEEELEG